MTTNNATNNQIISPLTTKGDLYGYDTGNTRFPVGSDAKVVFSDSTQTLGLNYDYPFPDVSYAMQNTNDFMITTGTSNEAAWFSSVSGTGAGASANSSFVTDGTHIGIMQLSTGTTTTGSSGIRTTSYVYQGNGQIISVQDCYLGQLSNGTDTFTINTGLLQAASGLNQTDSIYFNYTNGTNSGKFQCITNKAGVTTIVDSGITAAATTWYNFKIIINAINTSITFYINNSLVATITTNIPATQPLLFGASVILKSAGTTSVLYYLDYIETRKDYSTRR